MDESLCANCRHRFTTIPMKNTRIINGKKMTNKYWCEIHTEVVWGIVICKHHRK